MSKLPTPEAILQMSDEEVKVWNKELTRRLAKQMLKSIAIKIAVGVAVHYATAYAINKLDERSKKNEDA